MSFVSFQFIIFFILVTSLYFLLPHKFRWILLLFSSCIFYMAFIPKYIIILFILITIDYSAALLMDKAKGNYRKLLLLTSITATVLVLFIFKYFNFFVINLNSLAQFLYWNYSLEILNIILPIGLSFHTFQSLAYVIEVYRKRYKPERNLGIYALYVMFYPQLVAGPIERPQHLLPQFYKKHEFDYERVVSGLRLMLFGFFQKIVIADRLAIIVNNVYGNPTQFDSFALIFATIAFSFQIFCDFAGYSNIAIGVARVMGFNLVKNFDDPYGSKTIAQFWNRWHMSLYSWFRDYIYIPLGGSRVSGPRRILNILIVFLISGLWHGANWTFVAWGGLNGIYLVIHFLSKDYVNKFTDFIGLSRFKVLHSTVQVLFTFLLVSFSWILFRSKDFKQAYYIITHLFSNLGSVTTFLGSFNLNQLLIDISQRKMILGMPILDLILIFLAIALMQYIFKLQSKGSIQKKISIQPAVLRWSLYYLALAAIFYYISTSQPQFIYFQF